MGLVFAILGQDTLPAGLRVWIDDGQVLREALPGSEDNGGDQA